ncbi:protein NUCLEAR FUSION DEFECTIVE 4-like [Silene latifolia]|uniref:protein NUCLEAR FUSION DEFECTIVE 4-like n=1 Tax=Silene latifolia TaxID=37657 RepID=UPI003D7850F4
MSTTLQQKLRGLINNRWMIFVVAMWIQSCAGVGYLFGSISPVIKSTMGYNQKQVSYLGVAKNLGDCIGFISGQLCQFLPFWGILAIGALHTFVGYGLLWVIVTNKLTIMPFWVMFMAIFVGTNGETYYNTATLVSCVQNFTENRGPVVGILKGFAGLSGAILSQIYRMFNFANQSSLILMIALAPPATVLSLMFFIRSVDGSHQIRSSDGLSFSFVYGICILLAAYLMGVLLLDDLTILSQPLIVLSAIILMLLLVFLLIIPITLEFYPKSRVSVEESLLPKTAESYDETLSYENQCSGSEHENKAVVEEVIVRGEEFTVLEAFGTVNLWILFVSLVLGSGSGITVIDNMGQICQSLELSDTRIFVAMISVSNFLGRVGGGYFSELIVRKYVYPRPVALAIVQLTMVIGLLYYAMEWPAAIYVLTLLNGFGYGAHWAIAPATVSELFGLKSFGPLYNFILLAMPLGSFIFSTGLASSLYDYYAQRQMGLSNLASLDAMFKMDIRDDAPLTCMGSVCYTVTCAILSGVVFLSSVLSLIIAIRTRRFYANLYIKSPK